MKKITSFLKKHTWLFVILACLLFIPQSFNYQAKLNMRVVITGLAIDKAEDGYEVTAQVVIPSPGSESGGTSAELDYISETGKSIADGLEKVSYKMGKMAGLCHTDFVILGESMLEENMVTALDYFARDAMVYPSIMMLVCEGKAKDTIKKTKDLELAVSVGLQKVFTFKQNSLNGLVIPVDQFINCSYNISKSAIVSSIKIENEEENSSESGGSSDKSSSSSESQQGGSSSSGQSAPPESARIKYLNDLYYFKNGDYVGKLDKDKEILGYLLTDQDSTNGDFKVENVTSGLLENATIGLKFSNKKTSKKVEFKDGKPVFKVDINFTDVMLIEILNKGEPSLNVYDKQNDQLVNAIKKHLIKQVKSYVEMAFTKAKDDNVDIFDIAQLAYQTQTKKWKEFYKDKGEGYLNDCEIEVNVKIRNFS